MTTHASQGGFEFESKDPDTARRGVAITLGKNTQTFIRVPSTGCWGLAEWYPNARRARQSANRENTIQPEEVFGDEPEPPAAEKPAAEHEP